MFLRKLLQQLHLSHLLPPIQAYFQVLREAAEDNLLNQQELYCYKQKNHTGDHKPDYLL